MILRICNYISMYINKIICLFIPHNYDYDDLYPIDYMLRTCTRCKRYEWKTSTMRYWREIFWFTAPEAHLQLIEAISKYVKGDI